MTRLRIVAVILGLSGVASVATGEGGDAGAFFVGMCAALFADYIASST